MRTRAIRRSSEDGEVAQARRIAIRDDGSRPRFADNRPQSAAHRRWQEIAGSARKPWSLVPVVAASSRFERRGTAPGATVQCVGGPKFGLQTTGNVMDTDVAEGLARLKRIYAQYKAEVKGAKERATAAFKTSKMDDPDVQQEYTRKLAEAELTPEGLFARLADGLTYAGDVISYNSKEVARVRRGAAAYVQSQAAAGAVAAIYKKHTLEGASAQEYVNIGGAMVRRYAYREITPPERKAYKSGAPLLPVNTGQEATAHLGYKFEAGTGTKKPRKRDEAKGKVTDLEWLNEHAGTRLASVPLNPALLAFMQTRKGVGKELSATSTPKEITSNAGATFAGFGRARIDLARVPTAHVLHHYKGPAFTDVGLNTAVGRATPPTSKLTWETERANETVRRNRELVLSQIPAAAVASLQDAPARLAYEAEFQRVYTPLYRQAFSEELARVELNEPAPLPAVFPYVEDHYGEVAARGDATPLLARTAAAADVRARVDFAGEYRKAYAREWKRSFEDAAWDSNWVATRKTPVEDIKVPVPPEPVIPAGLGGANGKAQGSTDGTNHGTIAGAAYTG